MAKGQAGPRPGPVKPRKTKTKDDAPGAKAAKKAADAAPKKGHNSNGDLELTASERQSLFLDLVKGLMTREGKVASATGEVRAYKKKIQGLGFKVKQVQTGIKLATAEGEEKKREEIADDLQAAKWVGTAWGSQLDLFNEPDRTPAVDKAKDAGRMASMEDRPAKPPHSPETPQYKAWMEGWQEHQAEIAKGFRKSKGDNVSDFPAPRGEAAE